MYFHHQTLSGKRRIFNLLRREGTLSRAALAQKSGLTRPAVSAIVDELETGGLVEEIGRGSSTGGKPPILLALTPGSRCAVGLDLGDDYLIRGVLADVTGKVLDASEQEYDNAFPDLLRASGELVRRLTSKVPPRSLVGAGVAISGVVDASANEVIGAATLDVVRRGLAPELEKHCGIPVILERRPNAAALAEWFFGAGKTFQTLLYLTSGRGVGAGLVVDGEIYRGHTGSAGEVGGLRLPEGGRLEEITRPRALTADLSARKGQKLSFEDLWRLYADCDPDAEFLIRKNAEQLAYAAAAAANFFDPEAVVLGGRALEFGDRYFHWFQSAFEQESAIRLIGGAIAVKRSVFGSSGVAAGGAQVVLDRLIR